MTHIEFLKGGGRIEKGGAREMFSTYFMKFDIFETIFSANLVHFIRKLTRFPRICAQILFKTDILNFFPPKKGGRARAQEPPPLYTPLIATKLFLPGFEMHRIKLDHFFYLYYSTERNFVNTKFIL